MQLHELKTIYKQKGKKRVGRGGKRGTYSGHGQKGQKSRAGKNFKPIIRDLLKRYPKLRGYKSKRRDSLTCVLNVGDLQNKFSANDKVSPKILLEKKLIHRIKGKTPEVKILGQGEIKNALVIFDCKISDEAKEKIEKAGGEIKLKVLSTGRQAQSEKRKIVAEK